MTERLVGTGEPEELKRRLVGTDPAPRRLRVGPAPARPVALPSPEEVRTRVGEAAPPLTLPAEASTLVSGGLKISTARQGSVLDRPNPVVGMRVQMQVHFYDIITKEAATPGDVVVNLTDPDGEAIPVTMTEDPEDSGHFYGSFLPDVHGEWICELVYDVAEEVVDRTHVWVA